MRRHSFVSVCFAVLALSACSDAPPAGPVDAAAVSAPSAPVATDEAGLRRAASAALAEQRIYTPAGDNAIEHYLALRRLRPQDDAVATALLELLPYALIASEQAVGRADFAEARRLLGLIGQADPRAPALSRLRDSIVAAEAEAARKVIAEAEAAKRLELEQEAQLAAAEAERARLSAAVAQAPAEPAAEVGPASAPVPQSMPQSAPPSAAPSAPVAVPARPPVVAAAPTPRLLSAPPPRYPLVALRRKIEGEVTVQFTIQTDGSVSSPRVLSADPPGVFEEAALVAAARWRFDRPPAAMTSARVVQFRLGESAR